MTLKATLEAQRKIAALEAELAALKEAVKPFVTGYQAALDGLHPTSAPPLDTWAIYIGYRNQWDAPNYMLNLTADAGPDSWELMRGAHLRQLAEVARNE